MRTTLLLAALAFTAGSQIRLANGTLETPVLPADCFGTGKALTIEAGTFGCNTIEGGDGGGVPVGSILLIVSGACPTGYAEESSLNGKTLFGTLAANADVGGTGGNDAITPAGTIAWPAGVPTFAGAALSTHTHGTGTFATSAHSGTAVADHASHTHTYTDVIAHTHTIPVGATDDTSAPFDRADAGTNAAGANATTATGSTGVATGTTAGPSATLTHNVTQPSDHTLSGSSEAVSGGTPAGTVAWPAGVPTLNGTQFDNRSAFAKVIFCRKT